MAQRLGQLARRLVGPVYQLGRAYGVAAQSSPFRVGLWTTVLKTSAADVFAQKVIEQREEVDWRRNAVFASFGFAYLGCWQYYLYCKVFPVITPAARAVAGPTGAALILTFLDQCLHHPCLYFPAFYLLKGAMQDRPMSVSLNECGADMWPNLQALWTVWVPAQLVNFSLVPLHLRIPFVAGVSFAWTVILSVLRGTLDTAPVDSAQVHSHALSSEHLASVPAGVTCGLMASGIAAARSVAVTGTATVIAYAEDS